MSRDFCGINPIRMSNVLQRWKNFYLINTLISVVFSTNICQSTQTDPNWSLRFAEKPRGNKTACRYT